MVRTDWWAMPLLAGALLAGGVGARSGAPRSVFVNCETGDDAAGDGSRARPFLTPMRARNFVRGVHPFAREPVEVQVYGDCYPRNAQGNVDFSRAVLELEPGLDSGTKSAPISYTGDGRSRLLSGMKIPPSAWMPSAKNANVYAVDLLALGADPALFGSFLQPDNPGGQTMGRCTSRQAELFYGGKPMTIARYPNRAPSGDFRWLNISSVQDAQATFQVADERVLAWSQEPDVWIHGYWSFDWADSFVQVERIFRNTSTGKAQVSVKGPVLYGFSQRAKFYGINILSELDTPGEYYLDRSPDSSAFGTLYFWPPSDLDASEAFVSFGDYTLVLGGTAAGLRRADTALHALASGAAAHWSTIARTQAPAGQGLRSSGGGAVNKMKEETGADLFVSASVPSALSALFFASLYQLVQAETLDRAAQKHLRAAALAVFKAQEEGGGTGGDQWGRGAGREGGLFSTRAGGARPVAAVGWGIWDFYWEWGLQCLRHTLKVEASASSRRAGGTAEAGEGRDAAPGGSRKDAEALEYVKISGFGLHFSRVAGLRLVNGRHVEVLEVAVTNHGGLGLGLDGSNLRASHLEVAHIGCGAVQLSGGSDLCMGWDPNSCVSASGRGIEDAGNVLEHSSIHDFGRVCRAYMPGVAFEGAGHTVRSNAVYNAPHSGIFGRGNDCVFENNLLRDLAYESTDTGGFMTGRSWVRRGNVIANNRFERVKNTQGMSLGYPQVMGIYLDDMTSGYTIVGNHFVDLQLGIYIGGGRDLTVTSNTFEDIGDSSVRIDDRGLNWRHQLCTEGLPGPQTGFLLEQLRQVNYLVPPYATKYPSLASYPDIQPCKPTAIYIVHNTFSNSSQGAISAPHGVLVDKLNSFRHNAIPSRGTESRDVGGGGAASQPRPGLGGGWEHNSLGVKEDVQKDIFLETVLS